MRKLLLAIGILAFSAGYGQNLSTTVKGKVVDKQSRQPLIGAQVMVLNIDPPKGTVTDAQGKFVLEKVPIGRQTIEVTYLGYEKVTIPNLDLNTGKDLVLNVEMEEAVIKAKAAVISAEEKPNQVQNKTATVSARQLSIENSKRYAGSLNDVSRMAQNFAGVQGANDTRNDLVVRGNSSMGVLYRLEGLDIPNPNHFAFQGSTGGPISILNNNVLDNSDFFTGAFPAEYGNAYAGVFDLKMRNGNNSDFEYLGQIGFNGIEAMAEGPISRKSGASFLANYRYSTLQAFKWMGISFGTLAVPEYMDINFKLNFPHKNGNTYLFGVGGNSEIAFLNDERSEDDLFVQGQRDLYYTTRMGATGLVHNHLFDNQGYLRVMAGVTFSENNIINDTLDQNGENPFNTFRNTSGNGRATVSAVYNQKFNAQHFLRTGVFVHHLFFNLEERLYRQALDQYQMRLDYDGSTQFVQAFAQWQYKITSGITLNAGLHVPYYFINNQENIEPRLGLKWKALPRLTVNLAYGRHSQLPPMNVFFNQVTDSTTGETFMPNQDLDYIISNHYVAGIQYALNGYTQLTSEVYYQYLSNVPVNQNPGSYSVLNQGANFYYNFPTYLVNDGSGFNYGVELTLERFLQQHFYYLITASLFQSKYVASDGETYNTAFNGNYNANVLAGYERKISAKTEAKSHWVATFNLRFALNGGQRYTPFDLEASKLAGVGVPDRSQTFAAQFAPYWRIDLRAGAKRNGQKVTHELAVEVQNLTDRQNEFVVQYDPTTQDVETLYQLGLLPVAQYRVYF